MDTHNTANRHIYSQKPEILQLQTAKDPGQSPDSFKQTNIDLEARGQGYWLEKSNWRAIRKEN